MTHLRTASAADRSDDRFCERCGNRADPATTLSRVGLTTCRACGLHACQRCWARSVGWCPACGMSMVATPLLRSLPTVHRHATARVGAAAATGAIRRAPTDATSGRLFDRGRRPAFAAATAAVVFAAAVFAFVSGAPPGPTGGVAGATGTPGLHDVGLGGPGTSPVASGSPAGTELSATAPPRPRGGTPRTGAPAPDATPRAPAATPAPTPRSTPRPTPRPTPPSTPAPAPCTATAPSLVGRQRSEARRVWSAAGFTGSVSALDGHGNYVIATQDRRPGGRYPCDAGVTIGP